MIVKNEENTLKRCLQSVEDIVDEIIIVDTGSTDGTKELCKDLGIQPIEFKWEDDFSKARNFSFEQARKDYILWLDADDVIEGDSKKEFIKLKQTLNPQVDLVMMSYVQKSNGVEEDIVYWRERLLKRSVGYKWLEPVHEYIKPEGIIVYSDIRITHNKVEKGNTDRNIRIYEKQLEKGKELSNRGKFYYTRELYRQQRYEEAIRLGECYIQENLGVKQEMIEMCLCLAYCKQALGEDSKAYLYKSFKFDSPRRDICCEIGKEWMKQKNYEKAIFWLELALELPIQEQSYIFINKAYEYRIPYVELSVCYERLGRYEEAENYKGLLEKRR